MEGGGVVGVVDESAVVADESVVVAEEAVLVADESFVVAVDLAVLEPLSASVLACVSDSSAFAAASEAC